ncbi:MAG: phosphoenolpyruvate carboxykinase (GTP) [Acidimicrobiia bacterium]|nr:phosphoenolpyruvate carboxykinase (GTP) [Acidimicrobiia bacterium]
MSSEKTAAAAGTVGEVRFDPFAMRPFTGYHVADYMGHWLEIGAGADPAKLPRLFWVNWFRKGDDGKFLWPGFGDNARVLKWVIERVAGEGEAFDTPIGRVPSADALDLSGLELSPEAVARLVAVDEDEWRDELPRIEGHYAEVGDRLPDKLRQELEDLEKRLAS